MYEIKTLDNGIRVIADRISHLKSVSMGVWIGNGSRHERKEENGISHFIEHMLFKGTKRRSAKDIACEIDSVGGMINAFTAREYTCYYTKTLDTHAKIAMDVLSDMIFHSVLRKEDMDLERNVIYEEIGMYEDSPEDLVFDLASEAAWGDTALGRTVLGSRESLFNITPESMLSYLKTHYTSKNIVISVAGNIYDGFYDELNSFFGQEKLTSIMPAMERGIFKPKNIMRTKDIEQVQLVASFEGINVYDEAVLPLLVFNNVFGCGMSSRLFQNIREQNGLVYSIGAGHASYIDCGTFDISVATSPDKLPRVCSMISDEINKIKREKLSKSEIASSKEQLKGSYILSAESTNARMQGAGRSLLLDKPLYTQEEMLAKIDAITQEDVCNIIDRLFYNTHLAVSAVGCISNVDGLFDDLK